jgi:hypothetical protein
MKMMIDITLFENINDDKVKTIIKNSLAAYGFAPEHNYFELASHEAKDSKPVFVYFGGNKGLFGVDYEDVWQIISEILAPERERADLFILFAKHLFRNKSVKKIMMEFPFTLRKEIIKKVREENMQFGAGEKIIVVGNVVEHYYTPIISLEKWDPTLQGSEFSNLRKAKNRFFRNYKIELFKNEEIVNFPVVEIKEMVYAWAKNRKAKDRAIYDSYISFINNGCDGAALSLLLKVDGKIRGLASASMVPNTKNTVYYGINLHDYSIPELGDFLTVLFLDELKKSGFEFLNFGSSDKKLLKYKEKFKPISTYDSAFFYVRYEEAKKKKD